MISIKDLFATSLLLAHLLANLSIFYDLLTPLGDTKSRLFVAEGLAFQFKDNLAGISHRVNPGRLKTAFKTRTVCQTANRNHSLIQKFQSKLMYAMKVNW